MKPTDRFSRRQVLAAGTAATTFTIVPRHVLGGFGYTAPSAKLNIAGIGMGGMGTGDIQSLAGENIVALCDVDSRQGAPTFKRFDKAVQYVDFRKMLDREDKNIDAVVISTSDHMHATIALWCMQRGKHVYVEKPLTRTPWEANLLAEAAAKYKVATQMGNQGYSHEGHHTACEIVWSGEIGNVTEVHACTTSPNWPQGMQTIPPPEPVPQGFDWDLWLGCAPYRPYTSGGWDKEHVPNGMTGPYDGSNYGFYVPHDWRGFYDFGTGSLGDAAIHALGPANQALQLGSPIAVESVRAEERSTFAYPRRSLLRWDFPARGNMPPVSVYWHEGLRGAMSDPKLDYLFFRPKGLDDEILLPMPNNLAELGRPDLGSGGGRFGGGAGRGAGRGAPSSEATPLGGAAYRPGAGIPKGVLANDGSIFVGDKGYLATVGRGEGVQLLPAARWKDYKLPAPILPRSPGHYRDWIRACKGGEPACSNFSVAGSYAEWVTLGAIAYRFEGKLEYDPKERRFTNRPEANQYLKPALRKGWELKL